MFGKLTNSSRSSAPGELREPQDHRDTSNDGCCCEPALRQPCDVLLDRVSKPGATNPIDGLGQHEVTLEHERPPSRDSRDRSTLARGTNSRFSMLCARRSRPGYGSST